MQEQAYVVLSAIRCGDARRLAEQGPWVQAFQTIRWAQMTDQGIALTAAGRQALDEMDRNRRRPN